MTVAEIILMQLGGNRFKVMTGAKNFLGGKDYLVFDVPSRMTIDGVNKVRITLTSSDLYKIETIKYNTRNLTSTVVEVNDGVYNDQLCEIFTAMTGLYTKLF